ncbi:MAG TPA: protein kinase [Polyangiaceae bacterium]
MIDASELERTIRARVQSLSAVAATIAKSPRSTLVPTSDAPPHSGKTALDTLRGIARDPSALRLHRTLGEGGMGIVHEGHQVTLDRRVAVKTLRGEHVSDENIEGLLGEAWLAGSLEHPNVVPIYDLGLDERGAPLLVMKRIEGDTWSDLLRDENAMKRHALEQDPLEFNLRVLIQVCNAVHYAHSRDVVHRDLKPDNVMIGHFGEVYVLDWGVAMRAGPVRHVAGTIVYMAPEMLGGAGDVGARTDVYLLGAVLHELVTGKPPHDGANLQAMVSSVIVSAPKLEAGVPEELAALVTECMQRDPALRPSSALEVRRALELFLEHRGALALATQAEQKLVQLEALLAAPEVEIERAYNVFGECRFGFRQALRVWPEADVARRGLRRAVSAMVRFEAERGDARAAALVFADVEERDPELEALVDSARRRAESEAKQIEKLRELEKDLDPREGRRLRLVSSVGFGLLWALVPVLGPMYARNHPQNEGFATIGVCIVSLAIIGVTWPLWRATSRINRQLLAMFAFALAGQPALLLALKYAFDVPTSYTLTALMGYWCLAMGFITVATERRLAPLPIAYAVAFWIALRYPEHRFAGATCANLVAVVTAAIIWSRRGTEIAIERDQRRRERGRTC